MRRLRPGAIAIIASALLAVAAASIAEAQPLRPLMPAGASPQSGAGSAYLPGGAMPSGPVRASLAALALAGKPDGALRLRGAREIELYKKLAPSVALIVTEDGAGSGSLIALKAASGATPTSALLLTNAHVVEGATDVDVIFKPVDNGQKIDPASIRPGRVVKVDATRDLALVEVSDVPKQAATIALGRMDEVQVGADVHAIGHPGGQTWTYTKGLISQLRLGYKWESSPTDRHIADVIQTQTPINPGSSGGPLISDAGKLIGVNSFKVDANEGLNFAVAVGEVEKFLAAAKNGEYEPKVAARPAKPCKEVLYEGRAPDDKGVLRNLDTDCTGKVTASLYVPDDKGEPVVLSLDKNGDGEADAWIFDEDRDGKWDFSLWDVDFDGKPDLVGFHPDGTLTPTRYETYQPK
jgi:S1-C subfamily serine protease